MSTNARLNRHALVDVIVENWAMPPTVLFDKEMIPSGNEDSWSLPLLIALADLSAITQVDENSASGHVRFEDARDALTRRYKDTQESLEFEGDGYGSYADGFSVDDVEFVIESMGGRTQIAMPEVNMNTNMRPGMARRTLGGQLMGASRRVTVAAGPVPASNNRSAGQRTPAIPSRISSPTSTVINTPEPSSSRPPPPQYNSAMPRSPTYPPTDGPSSPALWALETHDPNPPVRHVVQQSPCQPMASPVFGGRSPTDRPSPAPAPTNPMCLAQQSRMSPVYNPAPLPTTPIHRAFHLPQIDPTPQFNPTAPLDHLKNMRYDPAEYHNPGPFEYPARGFRSPGPAPAEPTHPPLLPSLRGGMPAYIARMPQGRQEAITQPRWPTAAPAPPVGSPSSRFASAAPSAAPLGHPFVSPQRPSPTSPAHQAVLPAPPPLASHPRRIVSPVRSAAPSGRRVATPRRIVERDRRYRNIKNELDGTEFKAENKELKARFHALKRAMYDIEDEREDEEEEARKRARRE